MLNEIDPETGKMTNRFLETDIYNKGWNELNTVSSQWGFASKLSESPKYTHKFTDIFFTLDNNKPEPFISLHSKDLTTFDDIAEAKNSRNESSDILRSLAHKGKIYDYFNYYETQRHIFFSYVHGQKLENLIIDSQNKSVKKTYIFDDLVLIYNGKSGLTSVHIVSSSSDGLYQCVDIQNQMDNYTIFDAIKNNWLQPDLDKLEELKKLPEDTNPIIFYYTYE
jgi:hypothetical protein